MADHPILRFAVPGASFVVGAGLQLSGFTSPALGIALMGLGGLWFLAALVWPRVFRHRHERPKGEAHTSEPTREPRVGVRIEGDNTTLRGIKVVGGWDRAYDIRGEGHEVEDSVAMERWPTPDEPKEIQQAQEAVTDLNRIIEDGSLRSSECPTNEEDFSEPPPDVVARLDEWRARGEAALKPWPELQAELGQVGKKFPRWHAVSIGARVDKLTAIRTVLRQRYGL